MSRIFFAAVLGCAVAAMGICAHGDELAQAARALLAAQKPAVVTMRVTQKQKFTVPGQGTEEQESVTEVTGTIIEASGLLVCALTAVDPSHLVQQQSGPDDQFKMEIEVSKISMLLDGNKEIEAKIVLRDKDLDLAFIRPSTKQDVAFPFVDLAKAATPQQFDNLIIPVRSGKVANRAPSAAIVRVKSILDKPRTLYMLGIQESTLGSPAFVAEGGCVGICVLRTIASAAEEDGMDIGGRGEPNVSIAVLPGSEVLAIAKQAPMEEAKPAPAAAEPAPAPAAQPASPNSTVIIPGAK